MRKVKAMKRKTAVLGSYKCHPTRKGFFFPQTYNKNVELMGRKILFDCSTFYRIFNTATVKCFHFFLWLFKIIEKQTLVKVHLLVA